MTNVQSTKNRVRMHGHLLRKWEAESIGRFIGIKTNNLKLQEWERNPRLQGDVRYTVAVNFVDPEWRVPDFWNNLPGNMQFLQDWLKESC